MLGKKIESKDQYHPGHEPIRTFAEDNAGIIKHVKQSYWKFLFDIRSLVCNVANLIQRHPCRTWCTTSLAHENWFRKMQPPTCLTTVSIEAELGALQRSLTFEEYANYDNNVNMCDTSSLDRVIEKKLLFHSSTLERHTNLLLKRHRTCSHCFMDYTTLPRIAKVI